MLNLLELELGPEMLDLLELDLSLLELVNLTCRKSEGFCWGGLDDALLTCLAQGVCRTP